MNHQQNLSINSITSLIEPLTPPDNNYSPWNESTHYDLTNDLNLPKFNLNNMRSCSLPGPISSNPITLTGQRSSSYSATTIGNKKIDKDLLSHLNKLPLTTIKSDILKLSKDQFGCRFLQKKIDESLANFETIFQEIYQNIYELIIDPFGNYLVQKLINYCNELQLNLLMKNLSLNLFQISINQHGTRALQKIIEFVGNNYQINLITTGLKPYIIDLIKDLNGNHVIQKILNKFTPQDCQFIYDSICANIITVSTHKHGCCVLQKCLNHVTQQQLNQLANEIIKNCNTLIKNQFGNYVIQYLISLNVFEINLGVFEMVSGELDELVLQKFSSNVIEKFLKNCYVLEKLECESEYSSPSLQPSGFSQSFTGQQPQLGQPVQFVNNNNYTSSSPTQSTNNKSLKITSHKTLKNALINQILSLNLQKFINDPYGNYVVQTLIDVLSTHEEKVIVIKTWFKDCKIVSSFGKRIQGKVNSILNGGVTPIVPASSSSASLSSVQVNGSVSQLPGGGSGNSSVIGNGGNSSNVQINMNSNGEFIRNNCQFDYNLNNLTNSLSNNLSNLSINSNSNINSNFRNDRSNEYYNQALPIQNQQFQNGNLQYQLQNQYPINQGHLQNQLPNYQQSSSVTPQISNNSLPLLSLSLPHGQQMSLGQQGPQGPQHVQQNQGPQGQGQIPLQGHHQQLPLQNYGQGPLPGHNQGHSQGQGQLPQQVGQFYKMNDYYPNDKFQRNFNYNQFNYGYQY